MTTEKDIIRRNRRLLDFFSRLGCKVEIYGNINNPAIILEEKTVLSCYVKNFYLIFVDQPKNGAELFRCKLLSDLEITSDLTDQFKNWLNDIPHRSAYSIRVVGTSLRLSGYNSTDISRREETRYPVFSQYDFKYYFDKEYAKDIVSKYISEYLEIEVVNGLQ